MPRSPVIGKSLDSKGSSTGSSAGRGALVSISAATSTAGMTSPASGGETLIAAASSASSVKRTSSPEGSSALAR
ncbi:MAG: hypothetical protein GMKNLPBB_03154 [Myxococcota bacterium]|nr:hypothetical protein [Myxococcota bacterium]